MKRVRYAKPKANYVRTIRVSDMDRLGIKHKGEDLVFNQGNNFMLVMSNQMSESLVEKLPGMFVVADAEGEDETPEVLEPMTSLAASTAGSSEDDPDSSEASGDDEAQASTASKSKKR